jgi:hypothetical protein
MLNNDGIKATPRLVWGCPPKQAIKRTYRSRWPQPNAGSASGRRLNRTDNPRALLDPLCPRTSDWRGWRHRKVSHRGPPRTTPRATEATRAHGTQRGNQVSVALGESSVALGVKPCLLPPAQGCPRYPSSGGAALAVSRHASGHELMRMAGWTKSSCGARICRVSSIEKQA